MRLGKKIVSALAAITFMIAPVSALHGNVEAASAEEQYWRSMSTDFYYKQMSADEKKLYDKLDEKCMKILLLETDDITVEVKDLFGSDISIVDDDDLGCNIPDLFIRSNPQYFFLSGGSSTSSKLNNPKVYANGDGKNYLDKVTLRVFSLMQTKSEISDAKAKFKSAIADYVKEAAKVGLPEQKEHAVAELIMKNVSSNYSNFCSSAYGPLVDKKADSAGYSMLFMAVMNMCGNDCASVYGIGYSYNVINIHGFWYNVNMSKLDNSSTQYYNYNRGSGDNFLPFKSYKAWVPDTPYDYKDTASYISWYIDYDNVTYFICNGYETEGAGYTAVSVCGNTSTVLSTLPFMGCNYKVITSSLRGWQYEQGAWRFYNNGGIMQTGWYKEGGKWYFFNDGGEMSTGWLQTGGKWYYMGTDGAMQTGWKQISGKWYLLTSDGITTGWKKEGGKWYFFDSSGAMATGWKSTGGKWYYFNSDGSMVTGWKQISGKWYLFNSDGSMVTGWKSTGGKWYYFNSDGSMATRWKGISGKWYYLGTDGAMVKGWLQLSGKWYYLANDGSMVTGKQTIGSKVYNFGSDGVWDGK